MIKRKYGFFLLFLSLCLCTIFMYFPIYAFDETKPIRLIDPNTDIQVISDSNWPKDCSLIVKKIDKGSSAYKNTLKNFDSDQLYFAEKFEFYDISVLTGDTELQPDNGKTVVVNIPVPENFDADELKTLEVVYGNNNDVTLVGKLVQIDSKNYFQFETPKLGKHALIDIDTNKTNWLLIFSIVAVVVIVIMVYCILKNQKQAKKHEPNDDK